jgi:hypothetical protein
MSTPISDRTRSRAWLAAGGAAVLGLTAAAFACSQGGGGGGNGEGAATPTPAATATPTPTATATLAGTVSCAVNGAAAFATTCTAERALVGGAAVLVIRHADGGLRRFDVLADGTLAEADGAQRASFVRTGTTIDLTVGADRYRLDASLLGNAP